MNNFDKLIAQLVEGGYDKSTIMSEFDKAYTAKETARIKQEQKEKEIRTKRCTVAKAVIDYFKTLGVPETMIYESEMYESLVDTLKASESKIKSLIPLIKSTQDFKHNYKLKPESKESVKKVSPEMDIDAIERFINRILND